MSNDPSTTDFLTEGQRRHLVASLERVERALRGILELVGDRPAMVPGLFARQADDLPRGFEAAIVASASEATATLAELVAAFDLAPVPSSPVRSVQSLVVSSLVIIEDTASKTLRGYGAVHPGLPERLDPLLDRLHGQIVEIGRALAGFSAPRGTE